MNHEPKAINVALQGGGAHGAFTWGVLDRLLEDPRVRIEGFSGTSAGAMNAVCVADGLMEGGTEGARRKLRHFWESVSDIANLSPLKRTPIDVFMGNWSLDASPAYLAFDLMSRVASPYDTNPLNLNPLRDLIADTVDFDRVRSCDQTCLFISATNVETGRVRVFERGEITPDVVMASACLPLLFQAVEIGGIPYWDGGYMGNPVLYPFFRGCSSRDIVIVKINPVERPGTPRSAREILNRMNEITFNSSLLSELRAIDFVSRLVQDGRLHDLDYKDMHVHIVNADEHLLELGASSKLNAERSFIEHLFSVGRDTATQWLAEHFDDIGARSSVDLADMLRSRRLADHLLPETATGASAR